MQSRFARFRNVPELLRMWFLSADIKTAEDLDLPTPALAGGGPQTVVVPPSEQLRAFMATLSSRADAVQSRGVDPAEDNMLRIATHGRLAALDLRLLSPDVLAEAGLANGQVPDQVLLEAAADRIAATYHRHAATRYGEHPTPGALQLAFCDLGTPTGTGWNAYDELRGLLTVRGVPADQVRYMHEARNDREKGELFAAARSGRVAVLLGSTEKMGMGVNVQTRLKALHHIDCPWRPADLAQRDGRGMRQGNLNEEIELVRSVTRGSFAVYSWQTVERKARFINQVMRGRLDVREIEDVGDTALSYAEVKALASGDPRIMEKARVDSDTTRLERLHRAWARTQHTLQATLDSADRRLPVLTAEVDQLTDALTRHRDTRGDAFTITVHGAHLDDRAEAAIALRGALIPLIPAGRETPPQTVAQLGGFDVLASGHRVPDPHLRLELAGVPGSGFTLGLDELRPDRPLGIITRLENRAHGIATSRTELEHEITRLRSERDRAAADLGQPFPHADALATARRRSTELAAELAEQSTQHAVDANQNAAPLQRSEDSTAHRTTQASPGGQAPVPGKDSMTSSDNTPGIHVIDGEEFIVLEPHGPEFTASWLAEHAPRLYEQWRAHTDTGIRTEIAHRIETIMTDLDHIHSLETLADGPEPGETGLLMAELYEKYGPNEDAVAAAQQRAFDRDARQAAHAASQADQLSRALAHADIPLTDLELAAHHSGEPTEHALINAASIPPDRPRVEREPADSHAATDDRPVPSSASPFDRTPAGGWTDADRVAPAQPAATDTWPSQQRYPLGTALTVHAIGADGPGRRLGHGTVVDHPSPHHVTVESPYGTRRLAPISHVSPYTDTPTSTSTPDGAGGHRDPGRPGHAASSSTVSHPAEASPVGHEQSRPVPPPPGTDALSRWAEHVADLPHGSRLLSDPSWPRLADALDRAAAQPGYDLAGRLPALAGHLDAADSRPASDLLYLLTDDCPAIAHHLPKDGYRTGGATSQPQPDVAAPAVAARVAPSR
jgi:hypothetical protein